MSGHCIFHLTGIGIRDCVLDYFVRFSVNLPFTHQSLVVWFDNDPGKVDVIQNPSTTEVLL